MSKEIAGRPKTSISTMNKSCLVYFSGGAIVQAGVFYLLLKCLNGAEVDYALREIHKGNCRSHIGGRTLAKKVSLEGYFWLTLEQDLAYLVATCLSC